MVHCRAQHLSLRAHFRPRKIRSFGACTRCWIHHLLSRLPQGGIQLTSRSAPAKKYIEIVEHYESCLAKHGDSHLGVDWPKAEDAETRYRVMLELIPTRRPSIVKLLDFGCGTSHLYEHIVAS